MGFLSKRKPHEKKVSGYVHSSVLPILFAVGSRANTWTEATFLLFLLLTCTMYQELCRTLVFRFYVFIYLVNLGSLDIQYFLGYQCTII